MLIKKFIFHFSIDKQHFFGYNILCFRMNTQKRIDFRSATLILLTRRCHHEENIPAQEKTEKKGAWLQKENGNR